MSKKVITPAPEDFCKTIEYFKKSVGEATERFKNIVTVVRCKDCKHRDKEIVPDGAWEGYVFCKKDCAGHKDDWFCADGERK